MHKVVAKVAPAPAIRPCAAGEAAATILSIKAALAEDSAFHAGVPGLVSGATYGISDLAAFSRLGHGVPIIHSSYWCGGQHVYCFDRANSDAEFAERFTKAARDLAGFDLKRHGLCVAGGSVSALFMQTEDRRQPGDNFQDFDLYLVGHETDFAACQAIRALADHLRAVMGQNGLVHRTEGCVTFKRENGTPKARRVPIQVILRRYPTAASVIHGFDLGSSAILWDGERVHMTGLGKLAFERGANVLNLAARRCSYERRLARYFDRGFDLALPELSSACGLESLEWRLPYLHVAGAKHEGCACCITACRLDATRPGCDKFGRTIAEASPEGATPSADGSQESSDYESWSVPYGNVAAITRRNACALGEALVRPSALCAYAPLTTSPDVLVIEPTIDVELLTSTVKQCFIGSINASKATKLMGKTHTTALVVEHLMCECKPGAIFEEVERRCSERCAALNRSAQIPFAFMPLESRGALPGARPRTHTEAAEWYGAAHRF